MGSYGSLNMTNLGISARLLVSFPSPLQSLASPPGDTNKTKLVWCRKKSIGHIKQSHLSNLQRYECGQKKSRPQEPEIYMKIILGIYFKNKF